MNKAIIILNLFTIAHFFSTDSASNVKTLQALFLKVISFGNLGAQSQLSSSTSRMQTLGSLYSISEAFPDWLLSLTYIHLRVPYIFWWLDSSFLFIAEQYYLVWMSHSLFSHLSFEGHLLSFGSYE